MCHIEHIIFMTISNLGIALMSKGYPPSNVTMYSSDYSHIAVQGGGGGGGGGRLNTLRWRHNDRDGVSSHQPHDCLLNRLFGCRSKET